MSDKSDNGQVEFFKEGVTITFGGNNCKHKNGWYIYPTFWVFKRKYLVCSDCGELIPKSKWYLN